jgi:starch synthase (maltosyl-transferring)
MWAKRTSTQQPIKVDAAPKRNECPHPTLYPTDIKGGGCDPMLSIFDVTKLSSKAAAQQYARAKELGFDGILTFPFENKFEAVDVPADASVGKLVFIAGLPPDLLQSGCTERSASMGVERGAVDPRIFTGMPQEGFKLTEVENAISVYEQVLSKLVSAGYSGMFVDDSVLPFVEAAMTRLALARDLPTFTFIVAATKNAHRHEEMIFPHTILPRSLERPLGSGSHSIAMYVENAPSSAPFRAIHDVDQLHRYLTQLIWLAATDGPAWRCPCGMAIDDEICRTIAKANSYRRAHPAAIAHRNALRLNVPDTGLLADVLGARSDIPVLRLINTDLNRRITVKPAPLLARSDGLELKKTGIVNGVGSTASIVLEPGEIRWSELRRSDAIKAAGGMAEVQLEEALQAPRICIANLEPRPEQPDGLVKRVVGEEVVVECDLLCDGHDLLGGRLLWRPADSTSWQAVPLRFKENDRWTGSFTASRVGLHLYSLEVWRDDLASYQRELAKKAAAGQNIELEIKEGEELVRRSQQASADPSLLDLFRDWHDRLTRLFGAERLGHIENLPRIGGDIGLRSFVTRSDLDVAVWIDRYSAGFSAWYEIFPRSQSKFPGRHGTFRDVIDQLPAIRDMGFDTLYFPPIHPIGRINRKGRNNSLTAGPDEPGSPYAIGAAEGGHDALHPELGAMEDFRRLRQAAAEQGIELAMDFAIQCAPDHPWLKQHPEWFRWRPDGTIQYAENPPKKYEDIVNVDFYAPGARPSLWVALRDIVLFWRREGVRTFRVDNPHTKPLPFWRWLIRDIQAAYPDTVFLSEAFTRPKIMYRLAEIGFTQSYTYFTWRNTKLELEDYLTQITEGAYREVFRPHFFVNTPDINPRFLHESGRPGFLIRAALAATLSGLWGVYNGFEVCEASALPGKEEYLDSEKYQLRHWDRTSPGNIVAEITQLNRIRRENPAFHSHLGLIFLKADNDQILYFCKRSHNNDNAVLVAINLDPFHQQSAQVEIPLWLWQQPDDGALNATDLLTGKNLSWHGKMQVISLDPFRNPYAIWRIAGGA